MYLFAILDAPTGVQLIEYGSAIYIGVRRKDIAVREERCMIFWKEPHDPESMPAGRMFATCNDHRFGCPMVALAAAWICFVEKISRCLEVIIF